LRKDASASPVRRAFAKSWGAEYLGDGEVLFRVWAPDLERLRLRIDGRNREMLPAGQGWFTLTAGQIAPGTPYQLVMPDGAILPDPASRAQDGGIHGPSIVVDPAQYRWEVADWKGHAWEEASIHELDIGTFTPGGTFRAAAARLPELASDGLTMLQLSPLRQASGDGEGYHGALPYAPHHAYGSPVDMKAFVDAAHRHGLSVLLNVISNHFGPGGSFLEPYFPSFFMQDMSTPWGLAVNLEQPAVRVFFIESALYWLEEYNIDGLRLHAVAQDATANDDFQAELTDSVHNRIPGRARHLTLVDKPKIESFQSAS
jgi:malto-oligosyltrehalose trehalohydrolase